MDNFEDALTSAIPNLENLLDLCGNAQTPETAAATIARAKLLVSTVESKIKEAEAAL